MKNLKRALSFALASVMLVGMMVVGAGAASFKDAEDIQHTEAVNSMVALNLIGGRPNGEFDPQGTITRAEMAKLLCVAMNGGKDPQLSGVCQFDDVKAVNHWASGYIQFCVDMGYVSGRSATIFDPDAPITAQEAAKMMLTAIGYDANNEKFVGDGWGARVDTVANTKGLYDDVVVITSAKLSRDDAAQIVWNAMDATMVEYDWFPTTENGVTVIKAIASDFSDQRDILSQKFKLVSEYGYLNNVTYSETKKEFTYSFVNKSGDYEIDSTDFVGTSALKSADDYSDLFGMKVRVLCKRPTSSGTSKTVYGMYADGEQVMFSGLVKDIDEDPGDDFFDDYDLSDARSNISVIPVLNTAGVKKLDDIGIDFAKEFPVKVLDWNGDSKGDVVIVEPFYVGKVTFSGKDSITVSGLTSYKYDDDTIAEDLAKNDYVKVTKKENTADGKNVIAKIDVASGTVEGIREDSKTGKVNEIKIDGTWYTKASNGEDLSVKAGESWDLYVVGKYYYAGEEGADSKSLDDVVYVSASDAATALGSAKAKVYFMDGTSKIVNVSKVDDAALGATDDVDVGLYTFKLKNGEYELTKVDGTNKVGYDEYVTDSKGFVEKDDMLGDLYVADDAIIVVDGLDTKSKQEIKFYTGKEMKTWSNNFGDSFVALTDSVKGLDTAKVAVLKCATSGMPSGGDETYGYITSKPYETKVGEDTYVTYSLWTESGEVTVLDQTTNALKTLKKGMVVRYDDQGDGIIDNTEEVGTAVAIVGFNSKNIEVAASGENSTTGYKLNSDTKYLYVNTADSEGIEGAEIDVADEKDTKVYVLNAWVVIDGNGAPGEDVLLVVYDINNDIDGLDNEKSEGVTGKIS